MSHLHEREDHYKWRKSLCGHMQRVGENIAYRPPVYVAVHGTVSGVRNTRNRRRRDWEYLSDLGEDIEWSGNWSVRGIIGAGKQYVISYGVIIGV